jgi:MFS family permease
VADKYGRKIVMLYCVLAMSPAYLLCAIADSYTKLMILYMGINALWSMTWPASMALLIDATPMLTRDISVSMRQTCIRLGATVGPLVGGFIWELGGETRIFYVGAAFMAAAVTTILVQKEIKD